MDEVTTPATPAEDTTSERLDINGKQYVRSDVHSATCAEQYRVGVEHGVNIGKNKARTAIIDTIRDIKDDLDDAQQVLDLLLSAGGMEGAKLTRFWTVEVVYDGSTLGEICEIEAEDGQDACDLVEQDISFEDITVSVTFSALGQRVTGEAYLSEYALKDDIEYHATEEEQY